MAKKLKSLVILLVGLGLAWWFVSRLDIPSVSNHLSHANIWPLVVAYIAINLTMVSRTWRMQVFLKPIAKTSFKNVFAATSVGFGSIFVVGRAGELVRPAVIALREKLQPTAPFAAMLIERIFDAAAVVLMFA